MRPGPGCGSFINFIARSDPLMSVDAAGVEPAFTRASVGEVPPLNHAPGVFEAVAHPVRDLARAFHVWNRVELQMPEQGLFRARPYPVLKGVRLCPAFREHSQLRVMAAYAHGELERPRHLSVGIQRGMRSRSRRNHRSAPWHARFA